jgi:hypothetical protein
MMPSMSQIDMVVWLEGTKELQVCGNLEPRDGVASSSEAAEILVVVRQGGNVAKLHETRTYGSWELKVTLGPQSEFTTGRAVASAVVILKQEPAGLETISWVQPVTIMDKWEAPDPSQHVQFRPVAVDPPVEGTLRPDHSISSSLSIVQDDATGGTYRWQQQVEKTPLATHPTS